MPVKGLPHLATAAGQFCLRNTTFHLTSSVDPRSHPRKPMTHVAKLPRPTEPGQAVDLEHLRRYTFGDADLEQEVLQLFLDQLPVSLSALAAAKCERDWKMAAHALKGSGRGVGAWRIAALAETAEQVTFAASPEARSEVVGQLADAVAEAATFILSCKP